MTKKRFAVHGSSSSQAGASVILSEPVLVLARAVALVDGVNIEQLVAGLVAQRGRALGLDALAEAASQEGGQA